MVKEIKAYLKQNKCLPLYLQQASVVVMNKQGVVEFNSLIHQTNAFNRKTFHKPISVFNLT